MLINRYSADLIGVYEELLNIPYIQRITSYFGDYSLQYFKYGVTVDQIEPVYQKALAAMEMSNEELKQLVEELQQIMEDYMGETMETLVEETGLDDLAEELMVAKQGEMEPEDLERMKKRHRSDELREIMEADMKYLKAMINKLERERAEASSGNSNGVTLEISGVQMPVQAAAAPPVTPEGINVDLLL